jgi:hypothetical protein
VKRIVDALAVLARAAQSLANGTANIFYRSPFSSITRFTTSRSTG